MRSSAALVSVASSARRGSAARSLAVRLLAPLLTALSGLGRVLDRGAACAGLWLLLRGVLRSALVVALRSTEHSGTLASEDSFHAVRSAAA